MRRLQSFRHPNVVFMYDAFEENFLFYLALERCDTSLRSLLVRPLSSAIFVEIARQLLMALQYLHDNGVVHSDLHAGNVLVSQIDRSPVVKLTDFGVAHQLEGHRWFRPQVANPKVLVPELVTAGYTTTQSDLYQLGLLLFHMHTGQPALAPTLPDAEIARRIADGAPRQQAEALGTPTSQVIAKLLRRRDAYRYQSARQVWEDLRIAASQPG
jgi:serine/threonine-protein kinase